MDTFVIIALFLVSASLIAMIYQNWHLSKVVNYYRKEYGQLVAQQMGLIHDLAIPKQVEYKEPDGQTEAEPERYEGTRFVPDVETDEWMENTLQGLTYESQMPNEKE